MPADGRASIVNITSIEAHRAAPGFAIYSAMKAALVNLTKSLALELGDRRIRVNCIAPDVIPTPGIGGDVPVKTPLPVAGHVDDVAGAVDLPRVRPRSRFVTGTTIHVDGGNLAAGGWGRARRRQLGHGGRRRGAREVRRRARRAQPALPSRRDAGGRGARLRVGVAARASRLHAGDEPLAAPGRGPPAGPARRADLRRVRVPRLPRGRGPTRAARHARLQHRAAPSVHDGARRADRRHRCRTAASSSGSARRGSKRSGTRRSSTSRRVAGGSTRRSRSASGSSPRRRSRTTASSSRSTRSCSSRSRVQQPWPPILVGGESKAALRRAARLGDGWIGMAHTFESAAAQIERAARRCSPSTGGERRAVPDRARRSGRDRVDDVRRWEDVGVTRMIVSPWRRSPEAVEADAAIRRHGGAARMTNSPTTRDRRRGRDFAAALLGLCRRRSVRQRFDRRRAAASGLHSATVPTEYRPRRGRRRCQSARRHRAAGAGTDASGFAFSLHVRGTDRSGGPI